MKRKRLFLLFLLFSSILTAQEKGEIRTGIDLSIDNILIQANSNRPIIDWIGKSYTLSLNYNLTDNMNIGLKYLNQTLFMYDNRIYDQSPYIGKDGNILLVDYNIYLHKKKWSVSPFVEFGIGVLHFKSQYKLIETYYGSSGSEGIKYVHPKNTFSESIATGIEFKHLRLSIEYLFTLPKPTVNIYTWRYILAEGRYVETWNESKNILLNRLTLKFGFYLGGGNWKK